MTTTAIHPARSALRREQVALTERRILEAATQLFVERGYVATSLLAVAEAAGVSPRTVYVRFHSKARLFERCIETSITADQQPVVVAALESPILDQRLEAIVEMARSTMERSSALLGVAAQAAAVEPEIAAVERVAMQRALGDFRSLAERLESDGLLPRAITAAAVTDLLWVLAGPRAIVSLTTDRGWTPARFATWLDVTLRSFLRGR
ncbi:MAG: TetR/AcrR family transcriptional regulator [Candidatus Dormibacteraeota bacterium]|uniref:TetR/AcrR family transcriptional regulator n=1 Tax=Candidatus Aeolococcus gillhamiae TaxID=3127015 RepID=A0A934JUC1_9BACT|nr:TetR/AcrR family transcriptional regulator [Candidatus Dormibacteraeota bacterium]